MKNFTNNFKHKTNPLWIRLLIMAFMLLAGAGNAWAATIYFDNTNTKWSNVYIYLYDGTYWDYNNGSGANNIKACGTMTPIGNNIYSYTYSGNYNQVVSFTSQNQCGYNNFSGNSVKVCYSDSRSGNGSAKYTNSKPLFIPDTSSSFNKNNNTATYYHGDWATEPQIDIDPCAQKYYLKHAGWSGSNWAWKELTNCNDGVYTLEATYNGSGCNYNTSANDNGAGWIADLNNPNGIKSGTLCIFTFDPSVPSITITPKCTTAEFSVSLTNNGTVNKGQANIKASIIGTHSPAVTWSSSDSNIATIDANGNITAKKYGKVTITATTKGTDAYCSGTQQTAELTVRETPTITIEGNTTFCGESTTLTAVISDLTATNTNGKTITWYKHGGASSVGTGPTYNATATGTYTAKITGTYIKETTSAGFSVTKKATPTAANFTVTNNNYTYDGAAKAATVTWTDGTVADITKVAYSTASPKDAGSYTINVTTSAHGDLCASNGAITLDEKLTISPKTPETTDFEYTNQRVTYNGKAQTATVTWKDGYEKTGVITVLYDGESTKPTNVGTYVISVTSAASNNFNATESAIEKGTLTIDCAQITDVENNFVLSNTSYNYGELAKPTVSLKQNSTLVQAGLGAITTKYYNSSDQEVTNPTAVGTYTAKISIAVGTGYCALDETAVGNFTITCPVPAKVPTLSKTDVQKCNGVTGTKGTITITNYSTDYNGGNGYKFLLGDSFEPTIGNDGVMGEIDFVGDAETYKVQVATVCGSSISQYVYSTIQVNAINTVPTISLDPTSAPVCEGATFANITDYVTVNTNDKVDWYEQASGGTALEESEAIKVTTYYAEASIGDCKSERAQFEVSSIMKAPNVPEISPSKNTICEGESVDITLVSREVGVTYTMNSSTVFIEDETYNTGALYDHTSFILTATNSCGSTNSAELAIAVDKSPTFTAPAATQTNKEITLESAAGASTQWSVSPTENVTLTDNGDGTATFVATANGDYTITASNGVCAQVSHTIKVSDAFYVYMRQPKKGENAYDNFYFPTQNPTQGGDLFYKEYASIPPAEGYTDYNTGGVAHDIIFTDCDGYVWYGFKASDKLIDGTNYFTVRAPNEGGNGGYYTHTYLTKPGAMTSDIYYTMNENASGNSRGWYITNVSAPYAGPMVHASGSTALGTDKFVALYVTDCSGKEITSYQWYKGDDVYSSSCNYVTKDGAVPGDAGQTNNIRPTVAGNYSCKVTYNDGSSITSAAVPVTGTYSNSFTSNIPVIVVNTNGVGFPDCANSDKGHTPSAQTDYYKAKRSVDVKIYDGTSVIYDRKARMNYRGSSSLNFDKKSYAFCPGAANCASDKGREDYVKTEKQNMLGVGEAADKDWVLYAAAADPSLIRNRLVFDAYKTMTGQWSVSSRYVEVIVDGEYKGVYVFMDKITNNKKRVDITHADGFIVKFDKTDREDRWGGYNNKLGDEKTFKTTRTGKDDINTYDTTIDQRFEIEYPEKDDFKTTWNSKVGKIQQLFEDFETALADGDYQTVQKYIDYNSWADWFIINEYTKNVDAYRASCLFVYNGDKIEARPLWDQELSFNNTCPNYMGDYGSNDATGFLIKKDKVYNGDFKAPFWFTGGGTNITGGLLNDPCFVQIVKEKWNEYSAEGGILTEAKLAAKISEYETELGTDAASREANFWKSHSRSSISSGCYTGKEGTGYNNTDVTTSKSTMETWIKNRGNGLTTAINGLTGATFSIQIVPTMIETTPWEPAHIAVNVTPEGYDYTFEYTDNNLKGVANVIIEESGNEITYRIPRPADWAAGNETTEGERTDIEYGIKATLSVADGTTQCGSQAAPTSTAKIILQDEPNEDCE